MGEFQKNSPASTIVAHIEGDMSETINEYERERREKRDKLRALGVEPYGQRTEVIEPLAAVKGRYTAEMGHDAGPVVRVAGRVMLKRDMGKLSFLTLRDE